MSGSSTKTVTCNAQSNKDKRSLIPTCCQAPACCLASTPHVADVVYLVPSTNAVSSLYTAPIQCPVSTHCPPSPVPQLPLICPPGDFAQTGHRLVLSDLNITVMKTTGNGHWRNWRVAVADEATWDCPPPSYSSLFGSWAPEYYIVLDPQFDGGILSHQNVPVPQK